MLSRGSPGGAVVTHAAAGLICGVLAMVVSISFGTLIFAGDLSAYQPASVGITIFAACALTAFIGLTSSIRGVIAPVQEVPAVALSAVVASTAAAMSVDASQEARLATMVAAAAAATFLAGMVALLLGLLRCGGLIRFIPYPVLGGFLAGTGWLIVTGGVVLVSGEPLGPGFIEHAGSIHVAANICAAVALALVLTVLEQRGIEGIEGFVLPAVILTTLVGFNIVSGLLGIPAEQLRSHGWLVELPHHGTLWPPISFDDLGDIDWRAVAHGLLNLPTMVIMTVVALLMNSTGIELETRRDVDVDRELRSFGAANLATGAALGVPGFASVSLTLLAQRLGAPTRYVSLIAAAVCLAALLMGTLVLDAIPTFLLAGLLFWIGASFLIQWLVRSFARIGIWEYLIIAAIFGVIIGIGFVEGILFGIGAAVVLFVIEYSRVDAVRFAVTGRDYQSSAAASEARRELLERHGGAILIVRLQGFLFFGTADRLRKTIAAMLAADEPARYIVIDFARVTGLDSSTVLSFTRLDQLAERDGRSVVLSGLSAGQRRTLLRGGLATGGAGSTRLEDSLDQALRWCEDSLLADVEGESHGSTSRSIDEILQHIFPDAGTIDRLKPYLDRLVLDAGTSISDEGGASDDIYFIESGQATVEIRSTLHEPVRVAVVGPGAVVGELAHYLGESRSASITAESGMVVWRLGPARLDALQKELPRVASSFHQGMASMLARRLARTNHLVRFLAD